MSMVEEEFFWAGVLKADNTSLEWNPVVKENDKEPGMPVPRHSLILKQAILGPEAKEGEMNVVEVEAHGYSENKIKVLCAVMVGGKDHQRYLDLVFHDSPVNLRLIQGSGPVHLVGSHGVAYKYNMEEDEEEALDEEDEEIEEEEEEVKPNPAKKIKTESPGKPGKKTPQKKA